MTYNHLGQILEYCVIITIVIGVVIGMSKGFVRIFFSWFSVLLSVIVAMNFTHKLTVLFIPAEADNILVLFLMSILIFAIIHTVLTKIAFKFSQFLQKYHMGSLDFFLGAIFGAAQMMVLLGLGIHWIMALGWVDMTPYPVSMFCAFWSEKIIFMFGTQFPAFNKLIKK
ncbi:MAG: CvpA family protein [Brevinema sp.]